MAPRVVLLTGATTGIGLALARKLVRSDFRVVLTARASSLPRFEEEGIAESERVLIRPLDVVSDADRRAVVSEVERRWGGVDVLVNNAGVSYRSVVEHMTHADEQEQMDINFFGPMRLIRLVLPGMRARRRGHIINVSSVSGMMAMPTMGAYSASKWALEGATEALWYEMRPWGVHVTLVQPGFVKSSSFERVRLTGGAEASLKSEGDPYHAYYQNMTPFVARMMRWAVSTPEDVADVVLSTTSARWPRMRVAGTHDARLFYFLRRLLPRFVYHWVLYRGLPNIRAWGPGSLKEGGRRLVGEGE